MRKPSPATLIALIALFVALGGPAQAARLINGNKIKRNTITSKQIKQRTISSGDISKRTLRSLKARSRSVGSAQIIDGSVSLADMAFGSVTGNQVVDRSLTGVDIATESLTASELATDSVTSAELADDAVTNREIKTSSVTKGSIKGSSVGSGEIIDGDVRGTDLGADTATVDLPPLLNATSCSVTPVTVPAQRPSAARVVLVGQVADEFTLTARATGDTTLALKACNTSGAPVPAQTVTLPYLVIGA